MNSMMETLILPPKSFKLQGPSIFGAYGVSLPSPSCLVVVESKVNRYINAMSECSPRRTSFG